VCTLANLGMQGRCIATLNARCTVLSETCQRRACPFAFWMDLDVWHIFARNYVEPNKPFQVTAAPSSAPILVGRDDASAAFAAIAACAHQTSSSNANFVAASRIASASSMGLFAPIGEFDMKSVPGPVRASRTDRRSDRFRP
jgi:hypothetical protein